MNTVGRQAAVSSLILGLALLPDVAGAVVPAAAVEVADPQQTACGRTGPALAAVIEPFKALCPSPSSWASPECMAALDDRYWNRPVLCDAHSNLGNDPYRPLWWPEPLNDTVVWRQVFENPTALRTEVETATRDSSCRLRENQFRPDLRAVCAADAMARLGVLHRACRPALNWEANPYFDGWRSNWEERRIALEQTERDDYWQRVAELEDSELHFAWRLAKCRAVPEHALEPLSLLRPSSYYVARNNQRDQLVIAAARLGSVWAIGVGSMWSSLGQGGKVAVETWQDAPLPLAYVHWGWGRRDRLAYLLAAREEDLAGEAPQFDWRGLETAFTDEEISAARPIVRAIRERGWPPAAERELSDSHWPWMDQPTAVRVKVLRRRIDENGNIRWVYENGREEWVEGDRTYSAAPGGATSITGHLRVGRATLRRWTDADGTERWIDDVGDEHWIDADGAEHWIEEDGTEWILLPPEPPRRD